MISSFSHEIPNVAVATPTLKIVVRVCFGLVCVRLASSAEVCIAHVIAFVYFGFGLFALV